MRCAYCGGSAGWLRRRCSTCRRLLDVAAQHAGQDMETVMAALVGSGATAEQIEAVLEADPDGSGALRDRIAADTANQLLDAFGHKERQSPAGVKRLRERGNWTAMGQRPSDGDS